MNAQYLQRQNEMALKNQKSKQKVFANRQAPAPESEENAIDVTADDSRPIIGKLTEQFTQLMYRHVKNMPFINECLESLGEDELQAFVTNFHRIEPNLRRLEGARIDKQQLISQMHEWIQAIITERIGQKRQLRQTHSDPNALNLSSSRSSSSSSGNAPATIEEMRLELTNFACQGNGKISELEEPKHMKKVVDGIVGRKINYSFFENYIHGEDNLQILQRLGDYFACLNNIGIRRENMIENLMDDYDLMNSDATARLAIDVLTDAQENVAWTLISKHAGTLHIHINDVDTLRSKYYTSQHIAKARQRTISRDKFAKCLQMLNNYNLIKLAAAMAECIANPPTAPAAPTAPKGRRKVGNGIDVDPSHKVIGGGKYYINLNDLRNNILTMRYMTNRHLLNDMKQQVISPAVSECLNDEIHGSGVDSLKYHRLVTPQEKNLVRAFLHRIGSNRTMADDDGLQARIQVLTGELESGNSNVKRELRSLLLYATKRGIMSKGRMYEMIEELDI
jgi:hypothetical protein